MKNFWKKLRRILGIGNREMNNNKYLIVGLGNIGPEYEGTRHNAGFLVADYLVGERASFEAKRYGSVARFRLKNKELVVVKPSTFMNLSGNAVRYWMQEERVPLENVLIIVDELALPFGSLRLKGKGSDGGHNGLKHIQATLGTQSYARLRFGIGDDFPKGAQVSYVLEAFNTEEQNALPDHCADAVKIVESFCLEGLAVAMNRFNKTAPKKKNQPLEIARIDGNSAENR